MEWPWHSKSAKHHLNGSRSSTARHICSLVGRVEEDTSTHTSLARALVAREAGVVVFLLHSHASIWKSEIAWTQNTGYNGHGVITSKLYHKRYFSIRRIQNVSSPLPPECHGSSHWSYCIVFFFDICIITNCILTWQAISFWQKFSSIRLGTGFTV